MFNRNVAGLAIFNVFRGLAAGGYMALFSAYMSRLGYSMGDIGIIIAISNVVGFIASPAMGYILEVYSSRLASAATGLMISLSLLLAASTDNMAFLMLSYSLFLLAFYFGQPARMTFLAKISDRESLGSVVGFTSAALSAARTLGPPLAGFTISYYNYQLSFSLLAGLALIGSILFYLISMEPGDIGSGRKEGYTLLDPYKAVLKPSKDMAILYLFVGFDRAGWMLWFPMIGAYLVDLGYGESIIGILMGLSNLIETMLTPIMGRLTDAIGASTVLALSEATAALTALALIFSGESIYYAAASMTLIGLSISSWITSYNVYVAKVYSRMGEVYATANAIRSMAGIPAPYIGGFLYDVISIQAPFIISALTLLITTSMPLTVLKDMERFKTPKA